MSASKKVTSKKDITKALIGAVVVLLIIDLTPLGGNTAFYAKWLSCGERPVHTQFGAGVAQPGVPNYYVASSFGFMRGFTPYFCSPEDAEKAGYSANPKDYEFPHLSASELQQAIAKSKQIK